MTIEVKNDAMLGRNTDSTLHIELIKLQQEKQQLKEVIDEIKKVINNQMDYREFVDIVNAIEEILDKVGDNNV